MIYAFRHSQEITQVEMAKVLGISKQDLCYIEKGRKFVNVKRTVSFAEALDMPPKTFAKYALQGQLNKAGIDGEVQIKTVA